MSSSKKKATKRQRTNIDKAVVKSSQKKATKLSSKKKARSDKGTVSATTATRRSSRTRKVVNYNEDQLADTADDQALEAAKSVAITTTRQKGLAAATHRRQVSEHSGKKDDNGHLIPFADAPRWFRPKLTPAEMLKAGMVGGCYFNPKGGKPGILYPRKKYPQGIPGVGYEEFPKAWFENVPASHYKSRRYNIKTNRYGVKAGQDQVAWESSGWINETDPRGWIQWYFRFYQGRRLKGGEDERQLGRWKRCCGEKGRWKRFLMKKIVNSARGYDDKSLQRAVDNESVSPVVRQTLLHWAYKINLHDAHQFLKSK